MKRIDTNKTREELTGMFKEQKAKLLKLKFDLNEKKLKDVSQINKTKKDIARVMTALNNLK
ncbi:MAG: 50S ribosomal protein L29 [Candidatus Yanofskybacteria bacterium]|nr:50S ribosomal protein L29 [Candidatus Yanofskybacteria bacterium]